MEKTFIVDIPQNKPCYQVNPELWKTYNTLRLDRGLEIKLENNLITEQDVVIEIDLELMINE
jgi:hypothetical protein